MKRMIKTLSLVHHQLVWTVIVLSSLVCVNCPLLVEEGHFYCLQVVFQTDKGGTNNKINKIMINTDRL